MEPKLISIGKYRIWNFPHGGLWLSKEDGEGMQIKDSTMNPLEALIDTFWKEYF